MSKKQTTSWNDYLWIAELSYFALGMFNILFAWLGMIFFVTPLLLSFIGKGKSYCNHYCGRGQLFPVIASMIHGAKTAPSRPAPRFLRKKSFRYAFLLFFMTMFSLMIAATYSVFAGAELEQTITLLWTFRLPWSWTDVSFVSPWVAQFAFGFYSVMATSLLLGFISLIFYRPRTFCVYCPMGTMTQGICTLRHKISNTKQNEEP